jgi:cyanophycin synthetase
LNDGNLVQLGHGAQQRRIWTAETDRTSAIAEGISKDKDLTKQLLSMCGVPVPQGQIVDSPAAAWAAAQDIGLPVCVKPTDGNHARGVSLELTKQEDIEAAYDIALAEGSEVIVERFILGEEHRLLVVGDKVAAANKGETASVVGDGVHTVSALIETQINSDPRRGEEEDFPLDTIRLDEHTTSVLELKRQGLTADSVPEKGRKVLIMRTGNMAWDVTDDVHPDVAAQAVLAARVVGLDIAGVDLVAQDISQPLAAQGGAIVEVNAGPGLLMHLKPAMGQARPVGQAIANHLFSDNETGRIPVIGFMGDGDTTRPAKLVAWLLHLKGLYTGLACADGLFMNQRQLQAHGGMDFDHAQRLLINRSIQAAVFESDVRHLMTEGLPYDRCSVGVVTHMPKAAGLEDLHPGPDDKMPTYVRTQIDVVLSQGTAVLNAADVAVADLADHCDGSVIFYADDEQNPRLAAHHTQGGRVAFWRDGQLVLSEGGKELLVLSAKRPAVSRLLQDGKLSTHDMLVAACVAWALDIGIDLIRAGVKSYGQNNPH